MEYMSYESVKFENFNYYYGLMEVSCQSLNLLTTEFLSTAVFVLQSMKTSPIIGSAGKMMTLTEMKIFKQKIIQGNHVKYVYSIVEHNSENTFEYLLYP